MYIMKTNMSSLSADKWRSELNEQFPMFKEYTDAGMFDYLFSCIHVEMEDLQRAIRDYA